MSRADTVALKTLVETVPLLSGKVFVSEAKKPAPNSGAVIAPPYAVIHPSNGRNQNERLLSPKLVQYPRFTIHVVGVNGDQAQIVTDNLEGVLVPGGVGVRVSVSGRTNDPCWFSNPHGDIDSSVQPSVAFQVVECGWRSSPA